MITGADGEVWRSMRLMNRAQVIEIVRKAFATNARPSDDRLLHRDCCGDDGDIKAFYGKGSWDQIEADILERENASLCFFSPEAFRHFLPAYLIWTLEHFDQSDSFTIDSTIYSLNPTGYETDLRPFAVSKYSNLTEIERQAILAFLEFMATQTDFCDARSAEAARQYWEAHRT